MRKALPFYLIFTGLYGLMHALVFSLAAYALNLNGAASAVLALWLAAMALAPAALGLIGERTGVASLVCFTWMGIVFYLFLGSLALVPFLALPWPGLHAALFCIMVAVSLAACAYGFAHARRVKVRELTLVTDKLPPGVDRLRLAVISDLHLYSVEEGARLDRVLPLLAALDFDLLVSLGDLIESGIHLAPWDEEAARLARVTPRLGKYAVGGNHELYADNMAGADVSRRFHRAAGFELLDGRVADVGGLIWLAGVDYPGHGVQTGGGPGRDVAVLSGLTRDRPVVLLKHLPKVDLQAVGLFDLQLSGHSHAGQMWPFYHVVKAFFPFIRGLYDLGSGSRLYVTPGTGTWGPPMRVGTTPEITVVELRRGENRPSSSRGLPPPGPRSSGENEDRKAGDS